MVSWVVGEGRALRSVSRRATCEPSASAVERRGSSAEAALQRWLGRRCRSVAVAVAHSVMSKAGQLEVVRVRAAALCDRQQVVDLQQMGRGAAGPGERIAIAAASSVAIARRGAGQPRECGAVAGTGGGRGQNRGLCAPLPRLRRRAARRQGTRRVPASAPQWRPARPARRRRHGRQSAEAPAVATADAPLSPPSEDTPTAGSGAAVATGETDTPAPAAASAASAEAPPANCGAAAAGAADGTPPARAPSDSAAGADCGAAVAAGAGRWSATCAGAIRQCSGRRLRRRGSSGRARWSATCACAIGQCSGR